MSAPRAVGGSRFLYDGFSAASARIEANERIAEVQFTAISERLERIEKLIERLEKRLWLTVYGVLAVILARAAISLIGVAA